jgi:hypothetical protein
MRIPLKNNCETSRCLVVDNCSNDESASVIVVIVATVSLIIDDHVVQNNMLNLFFNRLKAHSTSFLIDACLAEKNRCFSC